MDIAITAFLVTIAIIAGILSPLIVVAVFGAISNSMKVAAAGIILKAEEVKKLPPFDDVELNLNPSTKVLTGRIIKNDAVLWQGSVTRNSEDIE